MGQIGRLSIMYKWAQEWSGMDILRLGRLDLDLVVSFSTKPHARIVHDPNFNKANSFFSGHFVDMSPYEFELDASDDSEARIAVANIDNGTLCSCVGRGAKFCHLESRLGTYTSCL